MIRTPITGRSLAAGRLPATGRSSATRFDLETAAMHALGYIRVDKNVNNAIYFDDPLSNLYGKTYFFVAKYPMKNVGDVAVSRADITPWVSITQTNAIAACAAIGTGYHLMTNWEWMAIARDVEQVAVNWTGGAVGSGLLKRGNVGILDDGSYNGATPEFGFGRNAKAKLVLSNGEEIWDLSGNVWEWTNNTISCAATQCSIAEMPYNSTPASEWIEFTAINTYGQLSYDQIRPSNASWNAAQGMGRLYTDADAANPSGTVHAFRRGGHWNGGSNSGAFVLDLRVSPASASSDVGFRCVR